MSSLACYILAGSAMSSTWGPAGEEWDAARGLMSREDVTKAYAELGLPSVIGLNILDVWNGRRWAVDLVAIRIPGL